MPRKRKAVPAAEVPIGFNPKVLEKLTAGPMPAAEVKSIFCQMKKAVPEHALNATLTPHMDYPKEDATAEKTVIHWNGGTPGTVLTDERPWP